MHSSLFVETWYNYIVKWINYCIRLYSAAFMITRQPT